MTDGKRLEEIRVRLAAAAPGPWIAVRFFDRPGALVRAGEAPTGIQTIGRFNREADADFAAGAHSDVPWLLARLEDALDWCARLANDQEAYQAGRQAGVRYCRDHAAVAGLLGVRDLDELLPAHTPPPHEGITAENARLREALRLLMRGPRGLPNEALGQAREALGDEAGDCRWCGGVMEAQTDQFGGQAKCRSCGHWVMEGGGGQ